MTAQAHENLIYEGKKTSMAFCPPLPKKHSRIVKQRFDETNDGNHIILSTACWRGYIGTWEIKAGKFYLVNIDGRYKITGDSPIFADWFSGVLRIPRGELIHYVHMGFGSVYEEEIHVKIEKGEVVKSHIIDNRNKDFNDMKLGWKNLPGFENRGDDM
jgi:hypothetical protein